MAQRLIDPGGGVIDGVDKQDINDNFTELYEGGVELQEAIAELEHQTRGVDGVTISTPVASTTPNGTEITLTVVDSEGDAIAVRHTLTVWISDDATGDGLTANSGGTLTAVTGTVLSELVDDKLIIANTAATGILKLLLVDASFTAGERVCCAHPVNGRLILGSATTGVLYNGGS